MMEFAKFTDSYLPTLEDNLKELKYMAENTFETVSLIQKDRKEVCQKAYNFLNNIQQTQDVFGGKTNQIVNNIEKELSAIM